MRSGSSGLHQAFSEITKATYAKIVSAWEARSGLASITLLSAGLFDAAFVARAETVPGLTRLSEPMLPGSKEVLLVPVSALKRGKIASAR